MYAAGEKKNIKYNKTEFANLISEKSITQVILIENFNELEKFLKNLISDEIVIGMGAGSISKHIRELQYILWV